MKTDSRIRQPTWCSRSARSRASTCRVTNTTGSAATLYGWIDYNANGVFDNATEARLGGRAQRHEQRHRDTRVPGGARPASPARPTARFRLSTDAAAANPTGSGDSTAKSKTIAVTITRPSSGIGRQHQDQEDRQRHERRADAGDDESVRQFGSIAGRSGWRWRNRSGRREPLRDDTGGNESRRGACAVHERRRHGEEPSRRLPAASVAGRSSPTSRFGRSLAALGDLDGDGVTDLAVGADLDDTGGQQPRRRVRAVPELQRHGEGSQKIASGTGGGPTLANAIASAVRSRHWATSMAMA